MRKGGVNDESLTRASVQFKNWIKKSEEALRPILEKTNDEMLTFFNTFPDINEYKYTIGGITYINEREAFMKKQSSKQ